MEPLLVLYNCDDVCPCGIALHFYRFKAAWILYYHLGSSGSDLFSTLFSILNLSPLYLQESPEGKKMLGFRRSLPSFKEKERLLQAIAQNQV